MIAEELGNEFLSVMNKNLRHSGIDIIGDVPWGTHFCQFYQTAEDLIDILVPYFKAGLENNEFCMWVTSQPLEIEGAKKALRKTVSDIDVYLEKGQLEIISYSHWYVKDGTFDSDRVLNGWVEKLNKARANGYDGLRLTGNTFWLEKEDWNDFVDYEKKVDEVLGNYQMIALCTYHLDRCNATEIIDVVVNHQFALIKTDGKWDQIESSKRKEAEKTVILQSSLLRESQAKLETAFASMTDAVFISDTLGNFVNFNDAFATFHKFKNKDECSKIFAEYPNILDVFMADGTSTPLNMWAVPRALRGETGTDVEYTLRRKDTGETWIGSYSFTPIRDNNGAIIGSIVIARDITERKRMEKELLQKTEIMDAISQNSSELIFAKDCHGQLVYASNSFLRFFNKSADEILGKTDVDFYSDPLISESVMENDRIVRETRQSLIIEESVQLPDGSPRIYLSIKSPWLAKDSTLLGTMGFSVDITERKRVEQEREETVEFLRLVNKNKGVVDLVHSAVNFFRERSGFEAVGIRLKDGKDYPYFETCGFSNEFVKLENSLCVKDATGQIICDSDGYPIHECMCGNVICGRFDLSKPFFTTRGSFCTNCTTELLATTTDADRQARTRNRCNGEGYESVALIALCVGEERLGLLQLNDRRKGLFTPETILMWERWTDYLAVAISKARAEESLQKAHENLQTQSEELQTQSEEIQSQNEELQAQSEELRETYKTLQESEERFRIMANTIPQLAWSAHPDGYIYWYNERWYSYTGTIPEQMEGWGWQSVHDPAMLPKVLEQWKASIATGQMFDMEFPLRGDDGVFRPFLTRVLPLKDSAGNILQWFGTNTDITDRKRAEKERERLLSDIQEEKDKLSALINSISDEVWFVDTQENFTLINPTGRNKFMLNKDEEVQAKKFYQNLDVYHPNGTSSPIEEAPALRALRGEIVNGYEQIVRTPIDGKLSYRQVNAAPVKDPKGNIIGSVSVVRDITEIKEAEKVLQESEAQRRVAEVVKSERQRLFDVLETLPVMVCLLTLDHHYAFTNHSFREKFGEHGNRHCYELSFGFNKPCEFCEAYKVLETGQLHHWEVIVPDGSVIDVYNFPFTDVDGSPMILEMDIDITERKKAEEELLKSERQFHALAEAMPQIVWITRGDGWNIYFNQKWVDYTGLTLEESYGHGWNKPFHPDDQKRAWDAWQNAVHNNRIYSLECRLRRADGAYRWWLVRGVPFFNESGAIDKWFGTCTDIHEIKQAEEKIRLSNIYNRSLIEASLDPLVTIGHDGKITDLNEATEQVTGYSRDELVGTDFTDYFTEPDKAEEGYQEVFKEGLISDYGLEIQHKDGSIIPVLYNASVYKDESGKVIGVFAAARDITTLKKADEVLKSKLEELARSNEELEQFAYISSHDLQEPLRMITSYLQLLQRKYRGNLDEKADMYIHFAVDGASRMQNLINDLLGYSLVSKSTREVENVDCEVILNNVLSGIKAVIKDNNATISHGPLPELMADSTQIDQVFQNLILNGIKYHGEEAPKIHIAAEKKAIEWVFSVHDNGIGIDPQYSNKIFEIFKRLHTKERYPGTGIGLAICKKIIEKQDGRIWVESELGKGSTFYFTLPIKPAGFKN